MPPPWDDEDGLLSDDLLEEQEEWVEVGEEGVHGFRAALFSSQAAHYARFRPSYPEHVSAGCLCWTVVVVLLLGTAEPVGNESADALPRLPASARSRGLCARASPPWLNPLAAC